MFFFIKSFFVRKFANHNKKKLIIMKRLQSTICSFFAVLFFSVLLVACNNKSYKVEVSVSPEYEGLKAYIFDAITEESIDSTDIVDGKALFKGKADSARIAVLVGASQTPVMFFLEPGTITIDADDNSMSGTSLNDDFSSLMNNEELKALADECESIRSEIYTADSADAQMEIVNRYDAAAEKLQSRLKEVCLSMYNSHREDILGAYVLTLAAQSFSFDELNNIFKDAAPVIKNFPPLAEIYKSLLSSEATQPGHHFVDIEGTDYATGKPSSLSKMIEGKVAVVDFWASWCRPCREEITNYLIPLYNEYKDKGVVVVGVDVSDQPEDHDNAVKELKIGYQQLLDSKKVAGELYGLTSIPQIILIDKDGNIVERDLRGDDIRMALEKLLNE